MPRLTEAQAAAITRARVLEGWQPEPQRGPPDIIVEPGRPGGVQAAIEAVVARARDRGAHQVTVALAPGLHPGLVIVPEVATAAGPLRFTLTGPPGAEIAATIDAQMPGAEFRARFAAQFAGCCPETRAIFERISTRDIITTANAAVVRVEAPDTRIEGLTIRNLYNCDRPAAMDRPAEVNAAGQAAGGQHQAVALLAAGADRLHLRDTRLSSFQDTLYLQGDGARVLIEGCDIEGDVDFIFGQATAWISRSTIRSRGTRAEMAWATAPSTNIRRSFGLVFAACDFTHDGSARALAGRFQLGRQWFEGVRATPYGTSPVPGYRCRVGDVSAYEPPEGTISRRTLESVGKCLLLSCRIGGHIRADRPWGDWHAGDLDGAPAPWHLRYRPVQASLRDFHAFLESWLKEQGLDYGDLAGEMPWLGEWNSAPGASTQGAW